MNAEPPLSTTNTTACVWRSARRVTWKPSNSSPSTAGRPGPGEIEVAVSASSINFADVLAALGRQPSFDGRPPALGIDFEGVVTAVGPGRHRPPGR